MSEPTFELRPKEPVEHEVVLILSEHDAELLERLLGSLTGKSAADLMNIGSCKPVVSEYDARSMTAVLYNVLHAGLNS